MCESAKLVGVDPHTYLLTATETALATPGAVTLPDTLLTADTVYSRFSASAARITTGQGEDLRTIMCCGATAQTVSYGCCDREPHIFVANATLVTEPS
jgi:hypothetical protein